MFSFFPVGIMVKIADDDIGKVYRDGVIDKAATKNDMIKLDKGNKIATDILVKYGIDPNKIFISKLRGAHPGGTAKIGAVVNNRLETRIKKLICMRCKHLPICSWRTTHAIIDSIEQMVC